MPKITNYQLPITEAIVVEYFSGRPDHCALITDLSDPVDPEQNLYMEFKCPRGTGAEYVRKTFGIEPTVSRIPRRPSSFSR